MHNFTKSTSSTYLQRPHESYSWPFKELSNKYFCASRWGRGCFVARLFSPTLSRFFHAPAAGDTGTPLFKILDPPLCIVHKHKTLPHSNPQSIPVPFPSQPPSPFQCLHSSAILQSNLPLQVNPVKRITIQGIGSTRGSRRTSPPTSSPSQGTLTPPRLTLPLSLRCARS